MVRPDELNKAFAAGDTAAVIAAGLAQEKARTVLDIGAGVGGLAKALSGRGYRVTGIDPNPEAIERARRDVADVRFDIGGAEALPFPDAEFDAAVFMNSLHHVPVDLMAKALAEAARVTRRGGTIFLIEPLAEGPQHEVMRPVEDETAVLDAAGRAVADAVRSQLLELRGNVVYQRHQPYADAEAFIQRLVEIAPSRLAVIEEKRDEVARLFAAGATTDASGGQVLAQPLRIYWLRVPD
ncbi:class I SAM-dependent methyltransferase [Aurantimonas endophytica]|uniref:Ubiquinone/menaquinone biosynthesis C-methylase UbiE n=1 Tax=Aurantimonas endophytica TaxID=1522175 RepID=A0A7W6HET0_9HYPH|nr:class I SAM-dependent methyltransferase [Aurantimonas endophytica]MBB4003914.1 ubiquinone/menaquinone biosynthesis C-methylase UbiE [Aurantimonas endophytica]MCO6404765.1 methyltransferase domain-containing protein [Aurantimonas endophytica]